MPPRAGFPGRRPDGAGEGARPERRLDLCPHGVDRSDGGQRVTVQGAEQAGRLPEPDQADDLGLHALRGDTVVAQDGGRRFAGGGGGEQEMLAADMAVPQPAGVLLGLNHDGTGAGVKRSNISASRPGGPACRAAWAR